MKSVIFHRNLKGIIKRLGDLNKDGRNYWLGYVQALKDEKLVTEEEWKMMADLILWNKGGESVENSGS